MQYSNAMSTAVRPGGVVLQGGAGQPEPQQAKLRKLMQDFAAALQVSNASRMRKAHEQLAVLADTPSAPVA